MKEHEIRPADLFQNYLDLAKQDIEIFLKMRRESTCLAQHAKQVVPWHL